MRLPPRSSAIAMAAVVLLAARAARADRAEAERLFLEARKLVVAGRCDGAMEMLRRSLQAEPSVGALLNLGTCEEGAGNLVGALRTFQRAEQLARRTDAERTEEAVRRQIAIEARLGSIRIRTRDDETSVEVNGLRAASGERIVLVPGSYEVVARAPGRTTTTMTVTVAAGKHDVVVDVAPPAALSEEGQRTAATGPREASGGGPSRAGPWLTLGIGIAALGASGISGLVAMGGRSELDELCPSYPACPAGRLGEARDVETRSRTAATVSTVSLVGAVALIGAGITWLAIRPEPGRVSSKFQPRRAGFARPPVDFLR